jgi:putative membrane protein
MSTPSTTPAAAPSLSSSPGLELSSRQSGLSFQRTRLSADRTLMSMLRTSISLVGFGFTISQFLMHVRASLPNPSLLPHPARALGLSMVGLGNLLLMVALVQHLSFRRSLRAERTLLVRQGLLHADEPFAPSLVFYMAALFLLIALGVLMGLAYRAGPFS